MFTHVIEIVLQSHRHKHTPTYIYVYIYIKWRHCIEKGVAGNVPKKWQQREFCVRPYR